MCYSATTSFGTFLFVSLICAILWSKGKPLQRTLAILLFFIALMQLVEGLLWLTLECNKTNVIISSFIPILLYLQPLVIIGTIYLFGTGYLSPTIYKGLLGIWLISLPLYIEWMKDGFGKCTTIGPNGHLVWPFTNGSPRDHSVIQSIYNIMLGLGFITLNTEWYGLFYMVIASAGYQVSRATYGHSWGSIWCHFVNILAVGALLI